MESGSEVGGATGKPGLATPLISPKTVRRHDGRNEPPVWLAALCQRALGKRAAVKGVVSGSRPGTGDLTIACETLHFGRGVFARRRPC